MLRRQRLARNGSLRTKLLLGLGSVLALFWGDAVVDWYLSTI